MTLEQYLNSTWEKDIFQKNQKSNNDIFLKPIDIGDNTIPNGNLLC